MLSDVSSLTDISSEDESTFSPSGKGKKAPKVAEYTLKGSLKAPRTVSFSAKHLYEEIMEGRIDLDPEYQRDVVWPDQKQIGLIDSILRNFYMPPVIFAVTMTEDGEEKRTCIDGKQRLTSIQRFMDGFIPYKDSRTNVKMWYKLTSSNINGKLLPQKYRHQFASKQIVCIEYSDITDDAEREIFQRVQLGVALTPAERMQAIPGPWSQLIREVLLLMSEYKMGEHLEWSSSRGRDFQCVTTALYLMEKKDSQVKSFPSPLVLDKWLQRVTPPTKIFKERVIDAFCVFRALVLDKENAKVFQKPARVSPIEFVMIVVFIDIYMTKYTLPQLALGITKMRADVRQKHTDIRANSKVTKTMHAFIAEKIPGIVRKVENGEKMALQAVRAMPPPSVTRENGKRKRRESSFESEESSDDGKPLHSKPAPLKKTARTVSGVASGSKAASPALSKQSSDRMSVDRPSTPLASTSKAAASRIAGKPSSNSNSVSTMASATPRLGNGAQKDRLAAMRAAKAATNAVKQTLTPTPPPRAPSRQSTSDASMLPPPTTPVLLGVDMSAVQNALQRTASGQVGTGAQSWPTQTQTQNAQVQAQVAAMFNQIQQQQQPQQHFGQPQATALPATPTSGQAQAQSTDPRTHPSRQAALAFPGGGDQPPPPRGIPHPDQQAGNNQRRNSGQFSVPGGGAVPPGGGAVPPRHRDRISRFDWQPDPKTNGGGS